MPLNLDSLLDASHLLTFVSGAFIGWAGTYLADKSTDRRREREKVDARIASFKSLRTEMPELFAEMASDLAPGLELVRDLVLLPSRGVTFYNQEPVLIYYETEHSNLKSKVKALRDAGFVVDITATNVPRYRMGADFVFLLKGK
jgi:hypothetical protein